MKTQRVLLETFNPQLSVIVATPELVRVYTETNAISRMVYQLNSAKWKERLCQQTVRSGWAAQLSPIFDLAMIDLNEPDHRDQRKALLKGWVDRCAEVVNRKALDQSSHRVAMLLRLGDARPRNDNSFVIPVRIDFVEIIRD